MTMVSQFKIAIQSEIDTISQRLTGEKEPLIVMKILGKLTHRTFSRESRKSSLKVDWNGIKQNKGLSTPILV